MLTGTQVDGPVPEWALLQRQLMSLMNDAVPELVRKFAERGGALYFAEDYDDLYEVCATWSLYYALGGRSHCQPPRLPAGRRLLTPLTP